MKLSYTIRHWPDLDWGRFCAAAADAKLSGLEIDSVRNPVLTGKNSPANPELAAAARRQLADLNLSIPCVGVEGDPVKPESAGELAAALEAARNLLVPYVVLHTTCEDTKAVIAALEGPVAQAERSGVTLLLETIGGMADTGRLVEVLDYFACDHLAACWNTHSTCLMQRETPEQTITNLGAYVRHVRLTDGAATGTPELAGEGALPMRELMNALRSVNYDGFISLVWDPAWVAGLDDLEMILTHYAVHMARYEREGRKSHLYYNTAGTGQYVWKKDTVIDCTFPQVLDRMVEEFPDQYAFKYTTLDYTRTYSQFRDDVDQFARSLIAMGVKPGDKVAIWATNVPAWFITFWAATKIGAVLVTVNTAYKIHEAEYLLRQSDTHTLVMIESYRDSHYAEIIAELCPELQTAQPGKPLHCKRLPFLRNIVTVGYRQAGCLTWEEAVALSGRVSPQEVRRRAANVGLHDVANMQYTSGTTGFPKGVMLTHYNVVNNGKYIGDHMDLSTADRMMIQVPMFHCFGMVLSMTASMTHGTTMCPLPYFSPKPALACVNQERITTFNGVPTMFIAMMNHEDFARTDFSHIRTGIMAGANCPPELMRKAADVMNMKQIISVFGQTEASPGCTMSSFDDPLDVRTETVGSRFANVECKIIDPDTGEECPIGVSGEFVARGYNIMKGYYKMPKATAETIDAEGWLHSGDLCCEDENGNFKVTGRLKDMIIRGGENIYPREIEEFIYTNPKVSDVQVIGVPDEQYGEEIMACIILKEGEEMTEKELKDFVLSHMAKHKVPRYVDFVKAFPMNAAGKILKYKMREEAVEKLGLKK
ncbi:MAG: AMP-binding protein [Oscillospiraceae bacterium]|jgi:fatty-acyl-CoA synthase|nr:AMP-binding protein [Oscillospiraceae bacterium]